MFMNNDPISYGILVTLILLVILIAGVMTLYIYNSIKQNNPINDNPKKTHATKNQTLPQTAYELNIMYKKMLKHIADCQRMSSQLNTSTTQFTEQPYYPQDTIPSSKVEDSLCNNITQTTDNNITKCD
ncbi:hypothetical protein EHRUM3_06530 [Ehrlichia ruminantium]|uniref:Uncharacterized protein n=2 Tax=Ehrlichia ruminantium TaxID=779 RepID=A0A170SWM2_EHRRU|nr:hypothetical protein EHRUM3_06530 [Ehrlichia ruminantium]